jgi:hypothetical protein
MEKTISYLNSKSWYRLIKVIYIISFAVMLVGYNIFVFSNGVKKLDLHNTTITCNTKSSGYKKFSLADGYVFINDSALNNYSYQNFYDKPTNEYAVEQLIEECSQLSRIPFTYNGQNLDIYDIQRMREIGRDNSNLSNDQIFKQEQAEKQNDPANLSIKYDSHIFDIEPKYTIKGFLEYFIIGNVIILVLFEILQRIFYYIVIGKIFPKKEL